MTELQFTVNALSVATRRKGADGREYLVAPGVAMVAGVLGNELVEANEIRRVAAGFAGRPIPLGHPKDANGQYISANSPDIHEASNLGYFWNARFEDDKLKGEYWIDLAKAQRMGGRAMMLVNRLEAGQPVETSTAYLRDFDPMPGVFNGKPYTGIARNLVPDHIAALDGEIGKCSIKDGCGLLANSAGGCSCGCVHANAVADDAERTGIMVAFQVPESVASLLALSADQLPEGSEPLAPNQLHVTLCYLGKTDEVRFTEMETLRQLLTFAQRAPVVRATIGGIGRFNNDNDGKNALYAQVDSAALMEWQERLASWLEVSQEHGYTPHITLAYIPADVAYDMTPPDKLDIVFDSVILSWGNKTTRFPLQGEVVNSEVEDMSKDKETPVENPTGQEPAKVDVAFDPAMIANAVQAAVAPLTAKLADYEKLFSDLGGVDKVREVIQLANANNQAMAANARREKNNLVTALVGNARCAFSKDELEKFDIESLSKLAQSLQPVDYSGRGITRLAANADEWEDLAMPSMVQEGK